MTGSKYTTGIFSFYHEQNSPSQIVFGKNSNLPNIIDDALQALEKVTTSADLALHIATLHSARETFMKAQTSEKIETALKKQTIKWEHTRCRELPLFTFPLNSGYTWLFYISKAFLKNIKSRFF